MAALTGDSRVAKRYAAALYDSVAAEGNAGGQTVDSTLADLQTVGEMLAGVKYLRAILQQPLVSDDRKFKVIADAFGNRIGATSLKFIDLLVRKRRENLIDECIAEFKREADERAGRVEAFVETPQPLDAGQLQRMQQALEQRTGKTIRLHASVDGAMLGGVRVRIGDDVIDAGLKTRLETLHRRLLAAR